MKEHGSKYVCISSPIPAGTPTGYYLLSLNFTAATPVKTTHPDAMRATITVSLHRPAVSEEENEVVEAEKFAKI